MRGVTATATVRDIVIGMADGLTVPFALAAGLSGVGASSGIVVAAGLAEIAAGSIAMELGGYLAAFRTASQIQVQVRSCHVTGWWHKGTSHSHLLAPK